MPKIPIPFIGGSESPRQSRHPRERLEAPFYPGGEEPAPEGASGETERAAAPSPAREDARPGLEGPPDELTPVEAAAEGGPPAEMEAAPEDQGADETEVPDWLLGSDAAETEPGAEPAEPRAGADDSEMDSLGRLAKQAEALLSGSHGDWIRTLVANLSPYTMEIAVPRAFAAGYLAARAEEEG